MERNYKVSYIMHPKESKIDIPFIRISGMWLRELGFDVGTKFKLFCGENFMIMMKLDEEDLKNEI